MSKHFARRFLAATAIVAIAATSFLAGVAYTHDAKLDLAVDNVVKAHALLEASDVPDERGQRCRKFVDKGMKLLDKTLEKIDLAATCADQGV